MAAPTHVPGKPRRSRRKRRGRETKSPGRSRREPRTSSLSTLATTLWPSTTNGRWLLVGILALGFTLRAYKLLSMFPILVDESIYLRWAEIIDHQGQWFISLLDGKQPLTYWILALLRKISDVDPLLQGRLLSVFAGLLSTIGVFAIGRRLGGEAAGLLSAFLYACFPFALLFDRLAYTEAFVNLFGVAIVLTSLECFQESGQSWKRELTPECGRNVRPCDYRL